eukprot:TRINITY_DN265_c7_g1_i1.p1 TRINITY_DN265_c7_g1~~TRINITY_DN265_c7_g1_i1.p1  ORF type:complete len:457 (-),score=99.71 TRINITY_DN265_c7_g1_i1:190-1560(-)
MGRKKVTIEYIKNKRRRTATFQGRKSGLVKKAMELSILCSADIVLLIRDKDGDLTQYTSSNAENAKELLKSLDLENADTNKKYDELYLGKKEEEPAPVPDPPHKKPIYLPGHPQGITLEQAQQVHQTPQIVIGPNGQPFLVYATDQLYKGINGDGGGVGGVRGVGAGGGGGSGVSVHTRVDGSEDGVSLREEGRGTQSTIPSIAAPSPSPAPSSSNHMDTSRLESPESDFPHSLLGSGGQTSTSPTGLTNASPVPSSSPSPSPSPSPSTGKSRVQDDENSVDEDLRVSIPKRGGFVVAPLSAETSPSFSLNSQLFALAPMSFPTGINTPLGTPTPPPPVSTNTDSAPAMSAFPTTTASSSSSSATGSVVPPVPSSSQSHTYSISLAPQNSRPMSGQFTGFNLTPISQFDFQNMFGGSNAGSSGLTPNTAFPLSTPTTAFSGFHLPSPETSPGGNTK